MPLPILSRDELDRMNAVHGAEYAAVDRHETLQALRLNGADAATFVRGIGDDDLRKAGVYLEGIPEMTIDQWIERVLIGHIRMHLASMRAVIDPTATASV